MLSIYGSLVILAFVNPIALDNIGWHYYIVFCCLLVGIFATVYFVFPETKGYSLEEITEIFDGPKSNHMAPDEVYVNVKEKTERRMSGADGELEYVGKV